MSHCQNLYMIVEECCKYLNKKKMIKIYIYMMIAQRRFTLKTQKIYIIYNRINETKNVARLVTMKEHARKKIYIDCEILNDRDKVNC